MSASATERAVSPVVGIALLLVITLLLAATVGAFALSLDLNRDTADGLVEGEVPTETGTESSGTSPASSSALILTKEAGEAPRTNKSNNLIFRIENTRNETVTVVGFAVNATGLAEGVTVNDSNAEEIEIRRVTQNGEANRDGSPDAFAADGTQYEFVADSTDGGQNATIEPGTDDAEVDIRDFSEDLSSLVITESAADADLTVRLVLSDGSHHLFHFAQQ